MVIHRNLIKVTLIIIICILSFEVTAICSEPSLTGDFPFDNIRAIYSAPFTHADRSDMLVIEDAGGLAFGSRHGGVGMGASKLTLFAFDGANFQKVWENGTLMLKYSLPMDGPISATTWCYGDFDGDGNYSIVTCNVSQMRQYTFVDSIFQRSKRPIQEVIKTPDGIWIDQMIACDINDDGKDEIVAYNYPDNPDSCCIYHVVIYKIEGDKPAGRSLVEIGRGPENFGGNSGVVPPNHFISTCHIEGIPGEIPVEMGSQSDMSLSSYLAIGKSDSGGYEIKRPFPRPPQMELPKDIQKGNRKFIMPRPDITKEVGPVVGVIFNDGSRILHYGYFADYNNPDPSQKEVDDQFALLEGGRWRLLQKDHPDIGGLLTRFTIAPGKSGWLFIKDRKYSFYDRLPVSY